MRTSVGDIEMEGYPVEGVSVGSEEGDPVGYMLGNSVEDSVGSAVGNPVG
jgi:hypothetical protein